MIKLQRLWLKHLNVALILLRSWVSMKIENKDYCFLLDRTDTCHCLAKNTIPLKVCGLQLSHPAVTALRGAGGTAGSRSDTRRRTAIDVAYGQGAHEGGSQ